MIDLSHRKRFTRSLAIILIISFSIISIGLPYNYAYASDITEGYPRISDNNLAAVSETVNQAKTNAGVIIAPPSDLPFKPGKSRIEIPSRRTANSKQYLESDGSFTVETYPKSIFYKNNQKKWVPIESDLVTSTDKSFKLKNKSNRFSSLFGDNAEVRFLENDISLTMQPSQAQPSQCIVNGKKIKYSQLYKNVDIEYTSDNDMIKEDIILNSPDTSNTFIFDLESTNLKIEKDAKTGLLTLYDRKDKPVAYFMAPFMIDAGKKVSERVSLSYEKVAGKEQLIVTADSSWLKDPNRQYPVKIDPTLISYDVHKDTFVSDWYPSTSLSSYDFLSSGYDGTSYGKTRSFIQYILPSLPSSASITSASFGLYQFLNNASTTVDAYKITSFWNTSATTWNAQPSIAATAEASVNSSYEGYWNFDISNLMRSWYAADIPNYGIAIKHRNENEVCKQFVSANGTNNTPVLTINYKVDPLGHEDQWGFTPEGVNGFNGNLLYQATDLNIPGRGIPVSFTRSYNSRSSKDSILGYGWVTNIGASLKDSGYGPVVLTDEDGTEHIFSRQMDGSFTAPAGVYLNLVKDSNNNTYTLTRMDGVKISFNSSGQITQISDTNKTANITTYNYTSGKLSSISDASGRLTSFYYNASGKLSKITDPKGRDINYGYDASGNLSTVTDPTGKITSYSYDASHNLTGITDPRNNTLGYGYDTANDRVSSVSRTITVNGTPTISTTSLSYDTVNNTTTRTDAKNNQTKYLYDPDGKIKEIIQDPSGLNYSTKFGYDVDNNVIQVTDPKNGNYTASYEQETGNLIDETNPLTEKYSYSYDSRNNQTQQIDPENRVDNYSYNQYNNNTDDTDAYTQTSADRYLDNGNVEYTTTPMSAGENLATNNSAERDADANSWPDEWDKYQETGKSAYFYWSTTSKFGDHSLGTGDTTGWASIMNTRAVAYDSTKTYVISGFIKTTDLSAKTAYIKADCYNAGGAWLGEVNSPLIGGTTDWTRVQAVLDQSSVPAGTTKFYASVARGAATGYARFDGIQVEVGTVQSTYNMVENASFELDSNGDRLPDKWEKNFTLASNEGRDTAVKHAGAASFKIIGQSGVNKYVKQHIYIKGDQNSKLTLSGWSYADNPDPNGGYYHLETAINYTDGTVAWNANNFSTQNHADMGWEHAVAQIKPSKAFSSIDVYYLFYNQTGNAWFDAMRLQDGNNISRYAYDSNGNYVTSSADPLNNTTSFEYDSIGNRNKVIDPKGNSTAYVYDLMNRLTKVTDALQGVTQYGYDDNGNRTSVTDAKNHVTSYGYNETNQVKSITDALNNSTNFSYDIVGNLTSINYPNSKTVGFGYDKLDRPTSILFNGVSKYTFGYDSKGNRNSMVDVGKSETSSYGYDADDKLTLVTEPNNNQVSYSYDKTGNVTALTTTIGAGNYTTSYQYDVLQQLNKVIFGTSWNKAVYNENGNLAGTVNSNNSKTVFYYDDAARIKNLKLLKANNGIIGDYSYTFDANSSISSVSQTGDSFGSKTISYTYDALNRLTSETLRDGTLIEYTYDAVGNRLTKKVTIGGNVTTTSYSYDNANQMTAVNSTGYSYDANGNMTSDGSRNFEYDANNRLIRVTKISDGSLIASYEYDGLGRRTSTATPASTTKFYYDGDSTRVLYETDGSGNLLARYIYGQNGQIVSMIRGTSTYFYHYNGHGDVIALTDSTGTVVAEYDYDAWGNPVTTGLEGTVPNPYRYAGYRYDSETGMYCLNARYYMPAVGRFITRDTFYGFENNPLSLNLYAYCYNNPIIHIDSNGHFPLVLVPLVGTAIAELVKAVLVVTAVVVTVVAAGEVSKVLEEKFRRKNPTIIYRTGSGNGTNLTPRPWLDLGGLSYTTMKPLWGPYTATTMESINATGKLLAIKDGFTHVSVRTANASKMREWADTRANANTNPHQYTKLLQSLSVKVK